MAADMPNDVFVEEDELMFLFMISVSGSHFMMCQWAVATGMSN